MPVIVSMLRGVNVGGRNKISMERLRALYAGLRLKEPESFIQSGNVLFETEEPHDAALAARIEAAIEGEFGFRPSVILRSAGELRDVIARNPFWARTDVAPDKLLVTFLKCDPGEDARAAVRAIAIVPEELVMDGSELFIYFPNGSGRSKLPIAKLERAQKTVGTARNWNSVVKLMALAEARQG